MKRFPECRRDHTDETLKFCLDDGRRLLDAAAGKPATMQGNKSEGINALERGAELSDRSALNLGDLGNGYAVTGNRERTSAIIKQLEEKYARKESIGQYVAAVYAGLGNNDEAVAWLEKDFQARSGQLPKIRWRSAFESIRSDSRFADLLLRMGLPQ